MLASRVQVLDLPKLLDMPDKLAKNTQRASRASIVIKPCLQDEAFLTDVREPLSSSDEFRLWWLGQSGYLLKWQHRHLLFDPYLSDSLTAKYANTDKPHLRMSRRVIDPQRLDFVRLITSSHNHTDHLDAETIGPIIRRADAVHEDVFLIVSEANEGFALHRLSKTPPVTVAVRAGLSQKVLGFDFVPVPAAHEELALDKSGRHLYLGYVVRFGAWTLYHSGDTVVYDGMAAILREHSINVAILPINGKVGNMNGADAARLANEIGAKLVIPCHYDMFEFNTADPYAEFVPECERLGQPYRVLKLGERWSSMELNHR